MLCIVCTYRLIYIWIGPQQITQQSCIGNLTGSANVLYLIDIAQLGTQTSMHADNLIINNCRARQTVEGVTKMLPDFDAVAATAFIVESIYAVNSRAFVVSPEDEEVFWILDFVSKEKADNLDRLLSAVYVVPKEEVVGLFRK